MGKNKSRTVMTFVIAFALLIIIAYSYLSYTKRRNRLVYQQTHESLIQDVHRTLPTGSGKAVVLQFLKVHSIRYYDFDPASAFGKGTVIDDPWYGGASGSVKGGTDWIGNCRLEVEFKFDEDDKLMGYRDKSTCKISLF